VVGNRAEWDLPGHLGGGVFFSGPSLRIERSSIEGNRAGGVVVRGRSVLIESSRIVGNVSIVGAGLLLTSDNAVVEARNSLFVGNHAVIDRDPSFGEGGAIHASCRRCSLTLWNCTVSQNLADHGTNGGGGIRSYQFGQTSGPTLTLRNSIVWGNEPNDLQLTDPTFFLLSAERCDVGESNLGPGDTFAGRNFAVDPGFIAPGVFDFRSYVSVQIAGEEVEMPNFIIDPGDYRLEPDSPLIDQGLATGAPAADIEGNLRPCGAGVDIGAYESGGCVPPELFVRGDSDASGEVNLTDAVFTLLHLFLAGERPPCFDAADADDSGILTLSDPVFLLNGLFLGGEPLPAPAGDCGEDPTQDTLSCETYAACPR
jgi:hypothetical protein